jgi:hypothetical protein
MTHRIWWQLPYVSALRILIREGNMKYLLATLFLVVALPAQIIVDPKGGGHYTDLQDAINAAPADSVIEVRGGVYEGPIDINKSLTIIALPRAGILAKDYATPPITSTQPPALTISASGVVTIDNFGIGGGAVPDNTYGAAEPALVGSCGHLRLLDCGIHGAGAPGIYGDPWTGVSAIDVSCGRLTLQWSTAFGSSSYGSESLPGPDGGTAVVATGDVVVLDSNIGGGNGGHTSLIMSPSLCAHATSGKGGDGIVADRIFAADSSVGGGAGGAVWGLPNCYLPNGKPYVANYVYEYARGEFTAVQFKTGTTWTANFPPLKGPGLLFFGESAVPYQFAGMWLFIDWRWIYGNIPLVPNMTSVSLAVPNNPNLIGANVTMQLYDFGTGKMSRPFFDVIR